MIKKLTIFKTLKLRRINPANKEIIAWEVLDLKEQFRYGIITKQYNPYFTKRIKGYKEVKVHYWIFYYIQREYTIGKTRYEALKPILDRIWIQA